MSKQFEKCHSFKVAFGDSTFPITLLLHLNNPAGVDTVSVELDGKYFKLVDHMAFAAAADNMQMVGVAACQ